LSKAFLPTVEKSAMLRQYVTGDFPTAERYALTRASISLTPPLSKTKRPGTVSSGARAREKVMLYVSYRNAEGGASRS
jgi:hypothetical protein